MAFQILLNFFIAVIWMFLSGSMTPTSLVIGYIIGMILIFLMRRFFNKKLYFIKIWATIKLIGIFFRELTLSNIEVLKVVLKPEMDIQPMIFSLPTDLKHDWEITLLSALITLTPGTIVVNISDDQHTIYVHAIDVDDVESSVNSIKETFEKAIKEVSRP